MNKILLSLLLGGLFLSATYIANAPDTGLVAYYSFNDCDAKDETKGGSDGNLFGNISCWCGVDGNGLMLNGNTDYIEFEGKVNQCFNTTDFTVSFYIKPLSKSIFRESLLAKRSLCDDNNMLDLQWNPMHNEVLVDFHENEHKAFTYLDTEVEGVGWYHIAIVRNGINAFTYVNGQLRQHSRRCSGVDIGNDALLNFGNSPCVRGGSTRRFKGVVDELRIYDKALDEAEIMQLYSKYPVEMAELNCVT